jgi:hypothetical protein
MPPGGFRTPAHGTRVPNSDADDVASQIAESLAARQEAQAVETANLTLVLNAIQEVKSDVRDVKTKVETQGATLNGVLVQMERSNGDTRVLGQRVSGIDESVKVLSAKMASVERGGSSTGERPAIRPRVEVPRSDGQDRVTISGAVKLIGAIFSGLALIAGAYFTGRGHGASAEKEAQNPPTAHAPNVGHIPP